MVVELGVPLDLPVVLMIIQGSADLRTARMLGLTHHAIRLSAPGYLGQPIDARAAVKVGDSWLLGQVVSTGPGGLLVIRRDGAWAASHRSAPRVRARVRARWCLLGPHAVEHAPAPRSFDGETETSVSGMVLLGCDLPVGARVSIELQLGEKGPMKLVAIVRRPTLAGAAVAFSDVRDDDAEVLADFVLEHL